MTTSHRAGGKCQRVGCGTTWQGNRVDAGQQGLKIRDELRKPGGVLRRRLHRPAVRLAGVHCHRKRLQCTQVWCHLINGKFLGPHCLPQGSQNLCNMNSLHPFPVLDSASKTSDGRCQNRPQILCRGSLVKAQGFVSWDQCGRDASPQGRWRSCCGGLRRRHVQSAAHAGRWGRASCQRQST